MAATAHPALKSALQAAREGRWQQVHRQASALLQNPALTADAHLLLGLACRHLRRPLEGATHLEQAHQAAPQRADIAVELASQWFAVQRHEAAKTLLDSCVSALQDNHYYLSLAAGTYLRLGLPASAWPLASRALQLQPQQERMMAGAAECAVFMGELAQAEQLYRDLLARHPDHQRYHYQLARLCKATDDAHIRQMEAMVQRQGQPDAKNIFGFYALAKELEDLGRWDEAFAYLERAGKAAAAASGYQVQDDIRLVDAIIAACDVRWYRCTAAAVAPPEAPQPIFITGLPRSGTTLVERILSGHSAVETAGESFYVQMSLQSLSGQAGSLGPQDIGAVAAIPMQKVAERYRAMVACRLQGHARFIEKLPENFLYLGVLAKAFPDAPLIHLRRHPLDACFALFKQSWFRYAYTLEDLGEYYIAYDRLMQHWRHMLGDRLIEIHYEHLVQAPDSQIRALLDHCALPFEEACLQFENNIAPSTTASAIQVREKMHQRSIAKWQHFAPHLAGLRKRLEAAGIRMTDV